MIKTVAEQAAAPQEPAAKTPEIPSAIGTVPSAPRAEPGMAPRVIADRYDIERELGQGGMGRVFLANDRKLARKVAIKLLSGAHTPDALQRFEQEARAAGSLNHPNILSVFDIGASESGPYIVSELLEGHTLRTRLAGKALPLRKVLDLAVQLAQGLSAAHDKGVIHRDLKPENLFVTDDGRLKILDFGIAKLSRGDPQEPRPVTLTGTVMGTVGYMSPEQVRGDHADHRTDVFSFGAILYELIAGRQAFAGHTAMETGSAILHDDPKPLAGANEQLEAIVLRCLEKDPRDRFQSARDLAFQLENIRLTGTGARPVQGGPSRRALRRAGIILALAGAAAIGAAVNRPERPSPPSFKRLSTGSEWPFIARFSPDGQTAYFTGAHPPAPPRLYTTRTDRPASHAVGLEKAYVAAISPEGEAALILDPRGVGNQGTGPGTLARLPSSGGAPRPVMEDVTQVDYLRDGAMMLVRRFKDGTSTLELPAGHVLLKKNGIIGTARVSPSGEQVAFLDQPFPGDDRGFVAVMDLQGRSRRLTGEWITMHGIAWSPDGKEIWFGASTASLDADLHAVTLDGRERTLVRSPGQLAVLDVDKAGRALVRFSRTEGGVRCLAPGATEERDCSAQFRSHLNDLSRDGKVALVTDDSDFEGPDYGVYLSTTDGSPPVRLGDGGGFAISPDSRWVAAGLLHGGTVRFMLYPAGVGEPRPLQFPGLEAVFVGFFPDGKRLLVFGAEPGHGFRAYERPLDSDKLRPITPEGLHGAFLVTGDGRDVVARGPDEGFWLIPVDGGEIRKRPPLSTRPWWVMGELADGSLLWRERPKTLSEAVVQKLDRNGKISAFRTVRAPYPDAYISELRFSRAGDAYAYSWGRADSTLFLVEGLR